MSLNFLQVVFKGPTRIYDVALMFSWFFFLSRCTKPVGGSNEQCAGASGIGRKRIFKALILLNKTFFVTKRMKFNNSSDEVGGVEAGTFGTLLLEVYSSTERQTAYYHNQLMKQGTITA